MNKQAETAIASDIREYTRHDLDNISKRIISHREILAHILKSCVTEFNDTPLGEIIEKGIVGNPEVSRIVGDNTEEMTFNNGKIRYDIRFRAITPSQELTELIVNIEAQNDYYPGYSLVKRGGFYCSTLLSGQKNTEFEYSNYDDIKKVYSIWICTRPPKERENSIKRYRTIEENVLGEGAKEPLENYDLMSIVMVYLGNEEDINCVGILRLLETLLVSEKNAEQKLNILKTEYEIKVTKELEKEVSQMCNISKGVEEKGIQKGIQKGLLQAIKNLMENADWSIEQAMKMLGISEEEQPLYREKLGK
jgi:hypothetical protein